MSDIKLFRVSKKEVKELEARSVAVEKSLQNMIETHLDDFLGIQFLASEYSTGKSHRGRIDSLGLDENGCPVIIEYKRAVNENVINQGLFYLDWLLDHKAEFKLLVMEKLGKKMASSIEWPSPRLLCIAGDFTKYDVHAVQQINRNIELFRYKRYGDDLLLLELVNALTSSESRTNSQSKSGVKYTTVGELLKKASEELTDLFEASKAFLLALGDDVQMKEVKFYFAFKRIRNYACIEVHPSARKLLIFVKIDPTSIKLEKGFSRDVRKIGHFGTGDVELTLKNFDDLEKAKPLLIKSYEVS